VNDEDAEIKSLIKTSEAIHAAAGTAAFLTAGGEDGFLHLWNSASFEEVGAFKPQ
jgi:hypothetical protein